MNQLSYSKITPRFNQVLTTAWKFSEDQRTGLIIDIKKKQNDYSNQQRIVAVGPTVRDLKVGDLVEINFLKSRYVEFTQEYLRNHASLAQFDELATASHMNDDGIIIHYPIIVIGGVEHFLIYDNDIPFSFETYDRV